MMSRQLIVVDCESTGLRPIDIAVEVAWMNVDTREQGLFIPWHDVDWVLEHAEPRALEINQYRERIMDLAQDDGTQASYLHEMLKGNTMAGSNPRADAQWLNKLFDQHCLPLDPWHYRLPDISSYAAGVLGIDLRELPGLWATSQRLGIEGADHTALGDVLTTVKVFEKLGQIRKGSDGKGA